jgi:hypothetical protein
MAHYFKPSIISTILHIPLVEDWYENALPPLIGRLVQLEDKIEQLSESNYRYVSKTSYFNGDPIWIH